MAQVGMWLAHELSDRPEAFVVRVLHRIEGPLDVARLEAAVNQVVGRHEMLRSTFSLAGEALMVTTFASASVSLVEKSLPAGEHELRRLLAGALRSRWKLLGEPMLRVILGQVDENTHVFGLLVHHAVFDSESMAMVLEEISEAYNGDGEAPMIAGSYGSLRAAQDDLREGPSHDEALERWRQILAGAPHLSRPRPSRPASPEAEVEMIVRSLGADEAAALQSVARRHRTTAFTVLFARLALALSSTIERPDVVVGTAVSTRFSSEWDRVVGLFADFAPVRVSFDGRPSLESAVEQVRYQLGLALSCPSLGFAEIVAAVNPERSTEERPLFQVYATQEGPEATRLRLAGLGTELLDVRSLQYPTDIGFELVLGEQPTIRCMWESGHHDPEVIRTLLEGLLNGAGRR